MFGGGLVMLIVLGEHSCTYYLTLLPSLLVFREIDHCERYRFQRSFSVLTRWRTCVPLLPSAG
jgi:hypothetical protein